MMHFTPSAQLISYSDLSELPSRQVILVDARGGADAFGRYLNGHLKGAYFADLETDLAGAVSDAAHGGRHPLPDRAEFSEFLGSLGISPESLVVVYDDKSGANAAARFWWMLKMGGHSRILVLDGGLEEALSKGAVLEKELPREPEDLGSYPLKNWTAQTVTLEQVALAAADPQQLVIDVREAYRYLGESEPIDLIAGHIPGAVNIPYLSNLHGTTFLDAETLALKYKEVTGEREAEKVIVHCGSGITACHTILAIAQAGLPLPKLYTGSWGEWSRNDRPVAVGN